jgi:hypothetical protein
VNQKRFDEESSSLLKKTAMSAITFCCEPLRSARRRGDAQLSLAYVRQSIARRISPLPRASDRFSRPQ